MTLVETAYPIVNIFQVNHHKEGRTTHGEVLTGYKQNFFITKNYYQTGKVLARNVQSGSLNQ